MPSDHRFGGGWTDSKLDLLSEYLGRYTIILSKQSFNKMYIDAFAGTGHRSPGEQTVGGLFDDPEMDGLAKGSACRALEVQPPFDAYIFVEKHKARFTALQDLELQYPQMAKRMAFLQKDANDAIQEICRSTDWKGTRAVMFLDPYGMQVDWSSIEIIAATKAIDLWYLVPAGMGVQRMIAHHGNLSKGWEDRLDRMLGERGWRDEFYVDQQDTNLFGEIDTRRQRNADIGRIERYMVRRLSSAFVGGGVAEHGFALRNGKGSPMYLLMFAIGNAKGAAIALRIVRHMFNKWIS